MTNAQAFDLMMARLAGRTATATRALVVLELNEKIRQLERGPVKPWFLETFVQATMVANQNYIDLPADFLEEDDEGAFRIRNLDATPAWSDPNPQKVPFEQLEVVADTEDAAIPEGYSVFSGRIYFAPVPDQAYTYKLKYFIRTPAVVDNTDPVTNPWLLEFFNFVSLATCHIVALTHLQSAEIAAKLQPELQDAYNQFWRAVESRKHANMQYLLGDEE